MPWLYKYSKEFLDKTIQAWQPLSKEPLTHADAVESIENMVEYFKVLLKIDEEAKISNAKAWAVTFWLHFGGRRG